MIKTLLDTSVWISVFGTREDSIRKKIARTIFDFLVSNPEKFFICYSERTTIELTTPIMELSKYKMIPYHSINEAWQEIEGTWDNWETKFGDEKEVLNGKIFSEILPDLKTKSNKRDRGIYADAVYAGCKLLLHENPKDFNKLAKGAQQRDLQIVNLLEIRETEPKKILEVFKTTIKAVS